MELFTLKRHEGGEKNIEDDEFKETPDDGKDPGDAEALGHGDGLKKMTVTGAKGDLRAKLLMKLKGMNKSHQISFKSVSEGLHETSL